MKSVRPRRERQAGRGVAEADCGSEGGGVMDRQQSGIPDGAVRHHL